MKKKLTIMLVTLVGVLGVLGFAGHDLFGGASEVAEGSKTSLVSIQVPIGSIPDYDGGFPGDTTLDSFHVIHF